MNILFVLYIFILFKEFSASNLPNYFESINNLSSDLNNTVILNNAETTLASINKTPTTIPVTTTSTSSIITIKDTVENANNSTNGILPNETKLPNTSKDIFDLQDDMFTSKVIGIALWAWIVLTFGVTALTISISLCFWNWGSMKIIGFVLREKSKIAMP